MIPQSCLRILPPVEMTHAEFNEDRSVLHFIFIRSKFVLQHPDTEAEGSQKGRHCNLLFASPAESSQVKLLKKQSSVLSPELNKGRSRKQTIIGLFEEKLETEEEENPKAELLVNGDSPDVRVTIEVLFIILRFSIF